MTRSICSPANVSDRGRMIGMPPPTAASSPDGGVAIAVAPGLEQQRDPCRLCGGEQLGSALCQQRLVGGDHRFARPQRPQHHLSGRFEATHHLNDQPHVGIVDDHLRIRREQRWVHLE